MEEKQKGRRALPNEETTKEEVRAQLEAHQDRITEHVETIEREARDQVAQWKDQAADHLGLLGAATGALGLLLWGAMRSSGSDRAAQRQWIQVPQRKLTDDYVDALVRAIEDRVKHGETLREALHEALWQRSPVLLRHPPQTEEARSAGWLVGVGLVAAVGVGLDYAARKLTGQGLAGLLRGLAARDGEAAYAEDELFTSVPGTQPLTRTPSTGRDYTAVHGTAGAELPKAPAPPKPKPKPSAPPPEATQTS